MSYSRAGEDRRARGPGRRRGRVGEARVQRRRQRRGREVGRDEAVLTAAQHLARAGPGRGDERRARGHGLDHRQWHGLVERADHHRVGARQQRGGVLAVAQERHPRGDPALARQRLQRGAVGALADQHEARRLGEQRQGLERQPLVLDRRQPADVHQHALVVRRAERGPRPLARVRGRFRKRDAVGDDDDPRGRQAVLADQPLALHGREGHERGGARPEHQVPQPEHARRAEGAVVLGVHDVRHAGGERGQPAVVLAEGGVGVDHVWAPAPDRAHHAAQEAEVAAPAPVGREHRHAQRRPRAARRDDGQHPALDARLVERLEQLLHEPLGAVGSQIRDHVQDAHPPIVPGNVSSVAFRGRCVGEP